MTKIEFMQRKVERITAVMEKAIADAKSQPPYVACRILIGDLVEIQRVKSEVLSNEKHSQL